MPRASHRLRPRALLGLLLLAASVLAAVPSGATAVTRGTIEGTGSTWSELIVQKWIADVDSYGMEVIYTGGGSRKGRKDFAQGTVDFAISEIPYQGTDELGQVDESERPYTYLPIVAGGTAFTYQLRAGGEQVRDLRLSGETLAKIFTNRITNWNDPQITEDNNGRQFPDLPIIPVVRADGSGTTALLTNWMDAEHPSVWRDYFGRPGRTSYYPVEGGRMEAASGSFQVMNEVRSYSGNGSIGYVEYAYPMDAGYPVVKVLNRAGYFVEPTPYNVAIALTGAVIGPDGQPTDVAGIYRHPDPRAYPLSSYSSMIVPTSARDPRLSTAKRQTLVDLMLYAVCRGQGSVMAYGFAPLPRAVVELAFAKVAEMRAVDPAVEIGDLSVANCDNPAFDGADPDRDVLGEIAPLPARCDRIGNGPCGHEQLDPPTGPDDNRPRARRPGAVGWLEGFAGRRSVTLRWGRAAANGARVQGYVVQCPPRRPVRAAAGKRRVVLHGLRPGRYRCAVRALNAQGRGPAMRVRVRVPARR